MDKKLITIILISIVISSGFFLPLTGANSIEKSSQHSSLINDAYTDFQTNKNIGNFTIYLGDVNSSYLQNILIPVYIRNGSNFSNLIQIFSFDSSLVKFDGIINNLASQNVNFSYVNLSNGIIRVYGNGSFVIPFYETVLYYLKFTSLKQEQYITTVLLDSSTLNGNTFNTISESHLRIVHGWTNLGPRDVSKFDPYTSSGNNTTFLAGTVPAIGYSPYNLSILYVTSGRGGPWQGNLYKGEDVSGFGGVFRSNDSGKTWYPVDNGLNSTEVTTIAVDPDNPNIVVVGTGGIASIVGGGIYKTINGGMSWQETYGMGANYITYYDGKLYAASYHAILVSYNFGTTWNVIKSFDSTVTTIDISNNGSTIFVGIYNPYNVSILRSTNGGETFSTVLTLKGYYSVSQIQTDPSNNSRMMALIEHGYTTYPNLFNSSDNGVTWNPINDSRVGIKYAIFTGPEWSSGVAEAPQYFTYDPLNGNIIYVIGPGYIYKSTNCGIHFYPVNTSDTSVDSQAVGGDNRVMSIDPLNDSIMFIGSDQGLYWSKDGGYNWTDLDNRSASMVYTVAASGSYIFTVVQDWAPIFSNNYGNTWFTAPGSEEGWATVDPYNNSTVVVESSDAMIVSNNGGKTFFYPQINNESYFGYTSKNVNGIVYAKNGTIFAAENGGIFKSNDNGHIWNLIPNSPSSMDAIAIDPINQNVLIASGSTAGWISPGTYESKNGGLSWTKINDIVFNSIAIDPSNDSIIAGVYYTNDYLGNLMMSFDGGKTFQNLNFTTINMFVASPQIFFHEQNGKTFMIYTTDQGIFESTDLGKTWTNITYNIPTSVISDLFISNNNSAYVSTYGMGVWYDPDLFNQTFFESPPILTGYLPDNESMIINGNTIYGRGYFSIAVNKGINTIASPLLRENIYLNGTDGLLYFLNLSSPKLPLIFKENGLQRNLMFTISINGISSILSNNSILYLPPGLTSISFYPVSNDFSIFMPEKTILEINMNIIPQTVTINYTQKFKNYFTNLTSEMIGNIWTTNINYNKGNIIFAGAGNNIILNISTMQIKQVFPFSLGIITAIPFGDGFLLGGTECCSNKPALFYYNLSTGNVSNLTYILPPSWNSQIDNLFNINSTSFGLVGGNTSTIYFGIIKNNTFYNLSKYIPSYFHSYYYSAAYISTYNCIIVSDEEYIGIFYLKNNTFEDISSLFPNNYYVGPDVWAPSYSYIATNGNEAMIIGTLLNGNICDQPMVTLFNPKNGVTDLSNLFSGTGIIDSVYSNGKDFVLTGMTLNGKNPPIFIYNPNENSLTEVNTTYFGNFSLIDSAILVNNSIYFTTFNSKSIPNATYVLDSSYYGLINLTPVGSASINTNVISTLKINNQTYNGKEFNIPLFSGNYSANLSSPGYKTYNFTVSILPFKTSYYNLTLISSKEYNITFNEYGLPLGTKWFLNLSNGQSFSSTNSTITFKEPNGSYSYTIATNNKIYAPIQYSGNFIVNGANINETITFKTVTYNVTFVENGLPSGTVWSLTINGTTITTNSTAITFHETNGSYTFTITPINGYSITPNSGTILVNGNSVNTQVTFTVLTYNVTFTESGLSSGTTWTVMLNGKSFNGESINKTLNSSGNTIIFNLPNGSYSYSIQGISGYKANNYSGSVMVSGNTNIQITWTVITYPLTITQTGIPNGTEWSVTLTGTSFNGQYINTTLNSTTNTITFNVPNGTYSYKIHLPSGYQGTDLTGLTSVTGTTANIPIRAQAPTNYMLFIIIGIVVVIVIIVAFIGIRMRKPKSRRPEELKPEEKK